MFPNLSFIILLFILITISNETSAQIECEGEKFLDAEMICAIINLSVGKVCGTFPSDYDSPDFSLDLCWFDTFKSKSKSFIIRNGDRIFCHSHVAASVLLGDRFNVKIPRVDVEVRHANPRIMRYHMIVNGLDGFGVCLHPSDLFMGILSLIQLRNFCTKEIIQLINVKSSQLIN